MASRRDRPIGWKKEAAALVCGLLFGAAWQAAHAETAPAVIHGARDSAAVRTPVRALVTPATVSWHKGT